LQSQGLEQKAEEAASASLYNILISPNSTIATLINKPAFNKLSKQLYCGIFEEKMMDKDGIIIGKLQQLSLDLYKRSLEATNLDLIFKERFSQLSISIYGFSGNFEFQHADPLYTLVHLKSMYESMASVNSMLLMAFELGMLDEELCIFFGNKWEVLKPMLQDRIADQEKLTNQHFLNNDEDQDLGDGFDDTF
jgi:hypothetical protein